MTTHITCRDPETGEVTGILCIDRISQVCNVLFADIDQMNSLVDIAKAHKVPEVRVVIPKGVVEDLQALGWKVRNDLVVMTKGD